MNEITLNYLLAIYSLIILINVDIFFHFLFKKLDLILKELRRNK